MVNILEIDSPVTLDDIISHELQAHQPYSGSNSFNNRDKVRISIQQQAQAILP